MNVCEVCGGDGHRYKGTTRYGARHDEHYPPYMSNQELETTIASMALCSDWQEPWMPVAQGQRLIFRLQNAERVCDLVARIDRFKDSVYGNEGPRDLQFLAGLQVDLDVALEAWVDISDD